MPTANLLRVTKSTNLCKMSSVDVSAMTRMYDYVEDVVLGNIMAGKYLVKACERYLDDLERIYSDDEFDWVWDQEEAARYINFIEKVCVHTRGKWAGQPLILSPWQVFFLGQLFGWVHKNDVKRRRFTSAHFFVARKSGKTQLAAAIILAMAVLDKDGAPQFVTAATKRDQAKEVFDEVRRCIKRSPPLSKRFVAHKNEVFGPGDGTIRPISSDANTLDGLSLNVGCVDEMHALRDGDLYRVLASSMGSRKSPLMLAISTAGFVLDGLATQFVRGGKAVLDGTAKNDSLLFLIYEIDKEDGDQWDDPNVWHKANPGLGSSIEMDYLQKQCNAAKLYGGRHITEFMVKHCNLFVGSQEVWVQDDDWMAEENVNMPFDTSKTKYPAYIGLDLAATDDVTALCIAVGDIDDGVQIEMHYFLPERAIAKKLERDENHVYANVSDYDNIHVIKGNTVDYNVIRRMISGHYVEDGQVRYDPDNICERYDVKGIAYDRWNSLSIIRDLGSDGLAEKLDPFGQGFASLSFPSKAFEKLAMEGKLHHGGDEFLRWMMSNVVLRIDPSGNIKPDKAKSGDKIDGVMAAIMAIGEMLTYEDEDSGFTFFMDVVDL